MAQIQELPLEKLRFHCDDCLFAFETTENVPPLEVMIGQERAVRAVRFGLATSSHGYNLFLSGLTGTGKITYAKSAVQEVASQEAVPVDWCYVNNFDSSSQPMAMMLPAGMGRIFKQDMRELVDDLKTDIPKAFSGEEYERAKAALIKSYQVKRAEIVERFNEMAEANGILPQWSTTGFVGVPTIDGKPLTPEEYQKLEKEEREAIEEKMLMMHERATEVVREMQHLEKSIREEVKELDSKIGLYAAGHLIEALKEKYQDYDQLTTYLEAVKNDVVKHIHDFRPASEEEQNNPLMLFKKPQQDGVKDRYAVNVLVDNHDLDGAPVLVETNPTFYNLVGRVEYEARMGVASTDFTMIKAGALHRANGGYLILNVKDVLMNIGAWEALKRVLKTGCLQIENLGEQYGMLAMSSLKPRPVPISVKVVLIGSAQIYQLLYAYDEDFRKLFKVHADFDVEMTNDAVNLRKLANFVKTTVEKEKLRHFDRKAVSKVVEYSCRLAGSQKKLTTRFNELVELLCEADIWAALDESKLVRVEHIRRAIDEKRHRANKYEEKLKEMFAEGKFLIDVSGEVVGQVNGLAVLGIGEYMFGKPSRITANTYLGRSGIINVEREIKMSGSSHSKGVLILSSYLGAKYAQKQPLSLTASLTFEQQYSGVDGDSASSTELYALLSSLSGLPLKQSIAITGSVNQKGEVQPIGGVTQKIEGFFAVCKIKGLTGDQGVMIPHQNVDELTLDDEVVEAVRQGVFHIYPVRTIDEGIELLTGVPAGEEQEGGSYPEGTVHALVSAKLKEYNDILLSLGKNEEGKKNGDKSEE